MPKIGRIYVRRSNQTDRAADISTQRQVENGKARLTARGVQTFAIYQEAPGIRSGTDDTYRPEFRRMLAQERITEAEYDTDRAGLLAELAALPRELPAQQEILSEDEIYDTVKDMFGTLRDAANVDPVLANDVLDQMFAAIVLEDSGELRFTPREAWRPFLKG